MFSVLCPSCACGPGWIARLAGTYCRDGSGGGGPLSDKAVRPCSLCVGPHRVGGGLGDTPLASCSLRGCAPQGGGTLCRWCMGGADRGGWVGIKEGSVLVRMAHTGQLGEQKRGQEGTVGSRSWCTHSVRCPKGEDNQLDGVWLASALLLCWALSPQCRLYSAKTLSTHLPGTTCQVHTRHVLPLCPSGQPVEEAPIITLIVQEEMEVQKEELTI